ncbi:MAG TPA: hypothetical protein VFW29_12650 [Solirubrobacteraceae bacterium]|nr:hypothetical protein [Solirubrobacteraceae bacterium]
MQDVLRSLARGILCLAVAGCASTVQPGLANGPPLGKVPSSEEGITDVVANGPQSCERALGPGPLRGQLPACPTVAERLITVRFHVRGTSSDREASRWLEHYWVGWPCPARPTESAGSRLVAWSPSDLRAPRCAVP